MDAKARPDIDLNDVALFAEVAAAASFSKAARARGVPVSTVSRRVARLEADLGARLIERTTRRLHLTDMGRSYLAHAERALDELGEASRQLKQLQAEPRGHVRITAPFGFGEALTATLAPYLAATPHVSVEIELTDRRVDVAAEGFDIAVRSGPLESADHVARKLAETTRHLFASRDYLKRRGRPERLADLGDHALIATRAAASGAVWDLRVGAKRQRFAFKPRLVVNELFAARSAARAGLGIVLLPALVHSGLERVLPEVTGEPAGLWLLYPARRSLTAAVRSCAEHLLATLPEVAAQGKP